MLRTLTYRFNGPPCQTILIKQRGDNGVLTSQMPAPNQQYPTDQTSNVASARASFLYAQKTTVPAQKIAGNTFTSSMFHGHYQRVLLAGKPIAFPISGSERVNMLKYNAIGKSGMKVGLALDAPYQTKNNDNTIRNIRRQRCRNSGCTAPKKKGAVENQYQSGGYSIFSSTGNRQIFSP